jgi:hypothetical protein
VINQFEEESRYLLKKRLKASWAIRTEEFPDVFVRIGLIKFVARGYRERCLRGDSMMKGMLCACALVSLPLHHEFDER